MVHGYASSLLEEEEGIRLFSLSFFFESVTSLLEYVQFPLNVKDTTFLVFHLVAFLYTVFSFSRRRAEISGGSDETPDPGVDQGKENPEWCGEWEDMGQILKEFFDSVVWDFPCDQIQNPDEIGKYPKEKCHNDSKEKKIIAVTWALTYIYHTLLDTEYASALAIMKRDDREETVLDMAKKIQAYADAVHGPTHARITAVETRLQKLGDKIEENHKKLKEEIKDDLLQILAVQIKSSGPKCRCSLDGERRPFS
ncbi:hypothetical protein TURU_000112 [Turdus rufiventris]|nr:hypothetical protein TURU_000112 [Turdus rufiventris]